MRLFYETYKRKIENEFFPERGFGKLRLNEAKKAISDFNKICNDEVKVLDLMIFYVEMGVMFTNQYGDIHERFYLSMESMFETVIKKLHESNDKSLFMQFKDRLSAIVNDTDGIGWGFHDNLAGIFFELEWLWPEEEYEG